MPVMAMHAICVQTPTGWTNFEAVDTAKGIYLSGWWNLSDEEIEALYRGWIYFHERSTERSTFVGRIEGLERRDDKGFAMLRVIRQLGKQQYRWRGEIAGQNARHYRRIVRATYPHELETAVSGTVASQIRQRGDS